MVDLLVLSGTVTASAETRTITGMLLPYGEVGRTNVGAMTVQAGAVTIPSDPIAVVFHDLHDLAAPRPIGHATALVETPSGITASFTVARTPGGDAALEDVATGARRSLSVEVTGGRIVDGQLVAGNLVGAALVPQGAFPSATVLAADAGEETTNQEEGTVPEPLEDDQVVEDAEAPDTEVDDTEEAAPEGTVTAARAPSGTLNRRQRRAAGSAAQRHFQQLAAAFGGRGGNAADMTVLAALDSATATDLTPSGAPNWIDEVWAQRTYVDKFTPLYTSGPLDSINGVGWQFNAGKTPTVAAWAGYDGTTQVNSTEVSTKAVNWTADRVAGANEYDIAFDHFGQTQFASFWSGFYREVTNDIARKIDAAALANMLTSGHYTAYTDPLTTTADTDLGKRLIKLLIAGIEQMQDYATPTFAVVHSSLWRGLLMTEQQSALAYINTMLGLDPSGGNVSGNGEQGGGFRIIPSSSASLVASSLGKVLVGSRESQTLYGPRVVRSNSIQLATGASQVGAFGYYKAFTNDARAFVLASPTS